MLWKNVLSAGSDAYFYAETEYFVLAAVCVRSAETGTVVVVGSFSVVLVISPEITGIHADAVGDLHAESESQ